jgi:hypothetical protein
VGERRIPGSGNLGFSPNISSPPARGMRIKAPSRPIYLDYFMQDCKSSRCARVCASYRLPDSLFIQRQFPCPKCSHALRTFNLTHAAVRQASVQVAPVPMVMRERLRYLLPSQLNWPAGSVEYVKLFFDLRFSFPANL